MRHVQFIRNMCEITISFHNMSEFHEDTPEWFKAFLNTRFSSLETRLDGLHSEVESLQSSVDLLSRFMMGGPCSPELPGVDDGDVHAKVKRLRDEASTNEQTQKECEELLRAAITKALSEKRTQTVYFATVFKYLPKGGQETIAAFYRDTTGKSKSWCDIMNSIPGFRASLNSVERIDQ